MQRARAQQPPSMQTDTYYSWEPIRSLWPIFLGVAAYGFIIGVVKVVGADASLFSPAAHTIVHHLAEVVVGGLVLSWVFLFKRNIDFSGLWRAVLLFTATGLVFLPLLGDLLGGIALAPIANLLIYLAIIAKTLFISENTVRSHSKRIYNKLNVHSKQELLNLIDFGEEG